MTENEICILADRWIAFEKTPEESAYYEPRRAAIFAFDRICTSDADGGRRP